MSQDDASTRSTHSNTVVITPYTSNNFDNQQRNVRRSTTVAKYPMTRTKKSVLFLLSCVVFLLVLCACLVAALVLVGRHVIRATIAQHNGGLMVVTGGAFGADQVVDNKTVLPLFRLPNDTRPSHYDITLMPDLQNASFKGKIKITIEISKARQDILLHSYQLLIDKICVEKIIDNDKNYVVATTIPPVVETNSNELNFSSEYFRLYENETTETTTDFLLENQEANFILNERNLTVVGFELLEDAQMLKVNLKEELPKGFYDVTIEFQGDMKNKLVGLHYIQYIAVDVNGTKEAAKRAIATTKFEPTYARQAYPCFDEPNLKATYKVQLLKPKGEGFVALSNMPQEKEEETTEGVMVHFATSEKMSTYLVCFIVSTLKHTEDVFGDDKKPLRVFATSGQESKTVYALDTGKKIMEFYLTYFDIPYPLPKLDMVAIPDFVSGAMENWGLVTYRETALLYDPLTSSAANKARVAEVIAHELAHSWFGNLVTMNWWDDLWLNEGFASYIEYKGVESAEPNWQMMDQFLISDLHDVFVLDATTASHPIVQKAETPDQITAMFDTISYKKGASILRMLEDAITPDKFKLGVTNYLNKYKWGNAVTENFWTEMTAVAAGHDISAIMKTWTTQMGYPVVTVTKAGTQYTLKQERYLTNSETPDHKADYKWTIPITYITNKDTAVTRKLEWFDKDAAQLVIDIPDATWVKFNAHQTGYYRVNYPETDWQSFATALMKEHTMFDVSDRASLLEESFRLAESGHVLYNIPLGMSKYLIKENNFICWSVADKVLTQLKKYLFNFASNEDYQKYVSSLLTDIVTSLGWDDKDSETDIQKRLRTVVLSLACSMGDANCLAEAQKRFSAWLDGTGTELSNNLRAIVYNYGTQQAKKADWYKVLELYKKEVDANEKTRLLDGLSRVKDPELLQSLILFAQDRQNIRDQDYFSCMAMISANPSGTALVWNYVRSNWQSLVDRFGLNERNLGRMIPQITKSFSTGIGLQEMEQFFEYYPNAGAGVAARLEAIETVKNNINWVTKYEKDVSQWINANKP